MASYEKYTMPVGKSDEARLLALNAICNPESLRFIDDVSLNLEGKTVADIGCGTGIMSVHWAKKVGKRGKVIAIDISEEQLAVAKAYAEKQGVLNIQYICLPVERLSEIGECVDLVYTRFLLEHLANPELAIKQMLGLIKPNGYLFCETVTSYEAIFSDPETEMTRQWREAVLLQPTFHQTDFYLGKRLFSLYPSFGLSRKFFRLAQPLMTENKASVDFSVGYMLAMKNKLASTSIFSEESVLEIAEAIEQYLLEGGVIAFPQYVQVLGQKEEKNAKSVSFSEIKRR
ncbi:MAG: hypothetical protein COV52_03195 [Gammaproteobacteria bacterium CG11_big_fil_rev_8_21_14_0_20_46_22]|nr:MAG: hypothetical protein COW05_00905 [Gammaproteobacteria bacterium CG12_big_fil_rev_8_21_14_0_65_46_12]PIR11550.1 MAG: hypothetical protein COV52_03195 [Gammaproteobacteria bacterium CG11_big_fil_rev_8_21_14_0_20_46_22]